MEQDIEKLFASSIYKVRHHLFPIVIFFVVFLLLNPLYILSKPIVVWIKYAAETLRRVPFPMKQPEPLTSLSVIVPVIILTLIIILLSFAFYLMRKPHYILPNRISKVEGYKFYDVQNEQIFAYNPFWKAKAKQFLDKEVVSFIEGNTKYFIS